MRLTAICGGCLGWILSIDPAGYRVCPVVLTDRGPSELELFAARMHEGLLAAAVAVGPQVSVSSERECHRAVPSERRPQFGA